MSDPIDQNEIFLKGKNVILKVLTEDDVLSSNWHGWFNDEDTTQHMQKHYFPNTKDAQLKFFRSLEGDKSKVQLGIAAEGVGPIIGIVSIQHIDFINRNADFSLLIGESDVRTLVYAQEAVKLILEYGFFTLNLHKIYGGYLDSLESWGHFLKKRFGFKDEGVWREHAFKGGKYLNIQRLGVLRREYREKMKEGLLNEE